MDVQGSGTAALLSCRAIHLASGVQGVSYSIFKSVYCPARGEIISLLLYYNVEGISAIGWAIFEENCKPMIYLK